VIPSKRPIEAALERPSLKELWGKINEARALVQKSRWAPAFPEKLKADFDELEGALGIETALPEDQMAILMQALTEIQAADYAGTRPPMRSYERATRSLEMFAFRWKSAHFNCKMYFKFSLGGADKGRRAWVYSIHPHREDDKDAD
jgi:hypothetical protein